VLLIIEGPYKRNWYGEPRQNGIILIPPCQQKRKTQKAQSGDCTAQRNIANRQLPPPVILSWRFIDVRIAGSLVLAAQREKKSKR